MISVYHSEPGRQDTGVRIPRLSSYRHQTLAIGGYNTASIGFPIDQNSAEDWFFEGVGRRVDVYSIGGTMIWQGLVNQVGVNIGSRVVTAGPYMDISNRIKVAYTTRDWGVQGAAPSEYAETEWAQDDHSIDTYGQLEEVVSGGQGLGVDMVKLRDRTLAEKAWSKASENTSSSPGDFSVSLSCIGLIRLLDKQVYNKAWYADGLYDLSAKINDILDANVNLAPGGFYTVPLNRQVESVGLDVNVLEDKNRFAWKIIKDHITKSNISVVAGMFADNTFVLRPQGNSSLENIPVYTREQGTNRIKYAGRYVEDSEMVPGEEMLLSDFNKPVSYMITSIDYDLTSNKATTNQFERSFGQQLSRTMLGGI